MSDGLTEADRSLGDRLLRDNKLDQGGIARASRLCGEGRGRLPAILSHLGLVGEPDIARALADETGFDIVGEDSFPQEPVAVDSLRGRFLKRARVLPLDDSVDRMRVAMADPLDERVMQALKLATKKSIHVSVAEATLIDKAIDRIYFDKTGDVGNDTFVSVGADFDEDVEKLRGLASEAPVIRTVARLIDDAVRLEASDIHVEPDEGRVGVRFRMDGRLVERDSLPAEYAAAVISRIKVMARLDIAERRLPQDGRVQAIVRGRSIDLRISTMPTLRGESAVVRILDKDSVRLDFAALGISESNRERLDVVLSRPNGMILVTGPTGSGKTTSLYAALSGLNKPDVNILTVEDPIEYELRGAKQVQVKPSIGLDFARVLRSMLRHDPDIILVGEIRDRETAEMAVHAALTGHLVLSTLHTNNAVSSIARLVDMGVESYLLTASISGLVAQRLVRLLCPGCKVQDMLSPDVARRMGLPSPYQETGIASYRAEGCPVCGDSGYKGRTSIMEIAVMTPRLRDLILKNADASILHAVAQEEGMRSMFEDGVAKVAEGLTTLDEVMRVTQDSRNQIADQAVDVRSDVPL